MRFHRTTWEVKYLSVFRVASVNGPICDFLALWEKHRGEGPSWHEPVTTRSAPTLTLPQRVWKFGYFSVKFRPNVALALVVIFVVVFIVVIIALASIANGNRGAI